MANNRTAADDAINALCAARKKLIDANVDFYVLVAFEGFAAEDGSVQNGNRATVIQRLEAMAQKLTEEETAPR